MRRLKLNPVTLLLWDVVGTFPFQNDKFWLNFDWNLHLSWLLRVLFQV